MTHKAYKTELDPNNKQVTVLLKHAGCARLAWNWGLGLIKDKKMKPNAAQLHKELVVQKQGDFSFMYEVSKYAPQSSLRSLEQAFKNFFAKRAGFPKFKSKSKGIGSFKLYGCIHVENGRIKLPKIGWIRLKQRDYIPTDKRIISVTVSEKAGRWFVSAMVEEEFEQQNNSGVIGIDLGVKTLATCSGGEQYANPRALTQLEEKIKHFQRKLSRKVKGSKRRKKMKARVARLWQRVTNIRKDATHKATSEIVKTKQPQIIVLEDLKVSEMVKNRKLAKCVHDANMREFRRQIEYKSKWFGVEVRFVDQYFPSSKMCSECGKVRDLKLSDRVYECSCGFVLDRDLNAALNLKNTVSSTGINAHGDGKFHVA